VSVGEAGQIMARSTDWIRARLGEGRLDGRQLQSGGPVVVTVASLARFIDSVETAATPPVVIVTRPQLYLAISNDP
jgi:hypothetical protein